MTNLIKKVQYGISILLLSMCCAMITPPNDSTRINVNEFKAHGSLVALLQNFDFDAKCAIAGFTLTRVPKQKDVADARNKGGVFQSATLFLINQAEHGDIYYFDDIKAHCPGDEVDRRIGSLVFRIK